MGGGVAAGCSGGGATSAAEASLKTGHEGVVAGELDWVAGPAAGPGSISGSTHGGDEQPAGRGLERAADRFVEEREAGGPVGERVGAREQPAMDDARLDVSRPVPAGTEHAEYLAEVGGLEGAAALEQLRATRHTGVVAVDHGRALAVITGVARSTQARLPADG